MYQSLWCLSLHAPEPAAWSAPCLQPQIILQQEAKAMSSHSELQKSQDLQTASVNKDLERQNSFIEKMRTEVKCVLHSAVEGGAETCSRERKHGD